MKKREFSGIGKGWLAILQTAYPRGVVDLPLDLEVTYFDKLYPRLRRGLARIKGAAILYEREGAGENLEFQHHSNAFLCDGIDDNADKDWGEWPDAVPVTSFSYHLFFIGLSDPALRVACESESVTDDEGPPETVAGDETSGYLVGVSLIAPVAIVQRAWYACLDDGTVLCPDLRDEWLEANDPLFGSRENLADSLDARRTRALEGLRASVARVLESVRLNELPSDLARAKAPGLRAGSEAWVGKPHTGHAITVQDAFFFQGP